MIQNFETTQGLGRVNLPHKVTIWPLLVAGVSAAASIAGGIAKSRTAEKDAQARQAMIDKERADNAALYNRRMYEDGTQRADVRRVLTEASDRLRRENMAASGRAAVMGGTNAQVAAAKEANGQAYAQAVSAAAAGAEARKDAAEERYVTANSGLNKQQIALDSERSQAKQAAISDAVKTVGGLASSYISSNYDKKV